ncbi:MAG: YedE family putative selenium transporter [Bacillota bacterium]|nr:YedE family putative selenium transporter [Bacillota bacterium]
MSWRKIWSPTSALALTGVLFGFLATWLVRAGNPGNMGFCAACFLRDIAGALGLHRAAPVQYLRPEIIGLLLGSFASALIFREFRARGGSSPLLRFFLGALVMIGALIFLGCPIRLYLRLAGGDWSALAGLAGLAGGVAVGVLFLKRGFSLGRASAQPTANGLLLPLFAVALLLLALWSPVFNPQAGGPIFASTSGPGAARAPLLLSLGAGLLLGVLAQRTRFCAIGGLRDLMLLGDRHLLWGTLGLLGGALAGNLVLDQFHPGFFGQPVAHNDWLWNLGGMSLVGLGGVLLGGCPLRQMVLSSEGDADAGAAVLGMLAGAAVAHNFSLASSPQGASAYGPWAVVLGLLLLIGLGLILSTRKKDVLYEAGPAGTGLPLSPHADH